MIRTGNTKRLSNFLLWQIAYTEIFFEKKLWPDFNSNDYKKILNKFKYLKRNFGNLNMQRFFLKKNFGQILKRMTMKKY